MASAITTEISLIWYNLPSWCPQQHPQKIPPFVAFLYSETLRKASFPCGAGLLWEPHTPQYDYEVSSDSSVCVCEVGACPSDVWRPPGQLHRPFCRVPLTTGEKSWMPCEHAVTVPLEASEWSTVVFQEAQGKWAQNPSSFCVFPWRIHENPLSLCHM